MPYPTTKTKVEIENSSESDFESAFRKCKSVFDRHASQAAMQDTNQLFTDSETLFAVIFDLVEEYIY